MTNADEEQSTAGARRRESAERHVLAALGVGRIVWGATTALASGRVHRLVGLDYPTPDRGIWIKAFGVRDVVLGAAALHPDETVRRATLRAGIAMDLFDAGAVLLAARRGLPRHVAVIGVLMAGGAATFGAAGPPALAALRSRGAAQRRPASEPDR